MAVFRGWEKVEFTTDSGETVEGIAPVIVSASRSTDIPACFPKWFANRLERGYSVWVNPFNHKPQYISFENTRLVVFWTKNPDPIMPYLHELERRGINYYFQFTFNDYEDERLEPGVPPLPDRVKTFRTLSERIGKERVVWRFDPLILSDTLGLEDLIEKVRRVGEQIAAWTEKLVISFADIGIYKKVPKNLQEQDFSYVEFTDEHMREFAGLLADVNKEWGLRIATCAEPIGLQEYGIEHNRCIDDELIIRLFGHDKKLMSFLGWEPAQSGGKQRRRMKDKGQRKECGCIVSKDIGTYSTCSHLCTYCYANTSGKTVEENLLKYDVDSDSLLSSTIRRS